MDFDFGVKTATGSTPVVKTTPARITKEVKEAAKELAASAKGLDIADFQRKHNIQIMNIEELLC